MISFSRISLNLLESHYFTTLLRSNRNQTLLVENRNSSSLLEIQDTDGISQVVYATVPKPPFSKRVLPRDKIRTDENSVGEICRNFS